MPMKNNSKIKRIEKVLKIILFLITCFITYIYLNKDIELEIPCIFHKITKLYCPGCGVTRMLFSMIKLEFYQAFRYNPLVFIYFPFIMFYSIYRIVIYINNKKDNIITKIPKNIILTLVIITIVYGFLRNTDIFSYLKPTTIK